MRHKVALLALAALTLTGCSSQAVAEPAPTEPATNCIEVSDGVATALKNGIDNPSVTSLDEFAAVPSPESDSTWYVAASFSSDPDGVAVWITTQDPTGDDAAFLSVDAVAEAISYFHRLDGGTAGAPGAVAAEACLN